MKPLHIESFLDPTAAQDRVVLEALGRGWPMGVAFFPLAGAATFLGAQDSLPPGSLRHTAQVILTQVSPGPFDEERFGAAIERYQQEHPLF
jgi:hypothetical protein